MIGFPSDEFLTYSELQSLVSKTCSDSEPFFLLAESFSTPLAITLTAHSRQNLKGLILVAGFAHDPARWKTLAKLAAHPSFFKITPPAAVVRFFLAGWDADSALVRRVQHAVSRVKPEVLSGRVGEALDCDVRLRVPDINVPLLCIQADRDNLLRRGCTDEIARVNGNAILQTISSPHMILQRAPSRGAELVAGFMQTAKRL